MPDIMIHTIEWRENSWVAVAGRLVINDQFWVGFKTTVKLTQISDELDTFKAALAKAINDRASHLEEHDGFE